MRQEDAIRWYSTPQGRRWVHKCLGCEKELDNPTGALPQRTGYCNPCFKRLNVNPAHNLLMKVHSSARGRCSVTITESNLVELIELGCCHYCDAPITWVAQRINLDRKDATRGYEPDNVVVCCFPCNRVKSNVLSYDEMRVAMQAVRQWRDATPEQRQWLLIP